MTKHSAPRVALVAICLVGLVIEKADGNPTDGVNANDIFFPYTPMKSETENIEEEVGDEETGRIIKWSWACCKAGSFISVKNKVHRVHEDGSGSRVTEEESAAGFEQGVCHRKKVTIFFDVRKSGNICYVQNEAFYKTYNMIKDTYTDHHLIKKKRCTFPSLEEAERILRADTNQFRFNIDELEEPEHYQNVALVVYDCKTPKIPLIHSDKKIWELKNRTLKLKNDGTTEHVQNLRNAGCRALGSYAITMYKNQPMANTTSVKYNCPDDTDGYEKRVKQSGIVKYVRKWRKDWAADNCFPTISKTQLDKNGDLQTITGTNFQSDDIKLHWAPRKAITNVGKAIIENAKTFLSKFPKVKIPARGGDITKEPSYVRRYFNTE